MTVSERFKVPEEIAIRVPADDMRATVESIFEQLGMPGEQAVKATDALIYADIRGIDSHGVSNMMPIYLQAFRENWINPAPTLKVVRDAPAAATVDNDRGLGLAVGRDCMQMAMDKAEKCGIGCVVATNGRHFGAAAYHAVYALERDMIGMALTIGGCEVAPTFGAEKRVGLNPIGIAVPSRNEPPYVFDASMSSVAGNKIRIARRLGSQVLPGWISDPDGTPIMEESPVPESFMMLPLGGTPELGSHKGFSLAMMVDVLAGLLGGELGGYQRQPAESSHHFLAYKVDAFTEIEAFKDTMDAYLKGMRETKTAPGRERVIYAGVLEHEAELDRRANGVPYHPDVVAWFKGTAAELGANDSLP